MHLPLDPESMSLPVLVRKLEKRVGEVAAAAILSQVGEWVFGGQHNPYSTAVP